MELQREFNTIGLRLYFRGCCFVVVLFLLFISFPGCGHKGSGGQGLLARGQEEGIPKPEHPRPDFQREQWKNLNGVWDFSTDPDDLGEQQAWYMPGSGAFDQRIRVPFPWESPAAGLSEEMKDYRGVAWYRRNFKVPDDWDGRRILLRFGAVDWSCKVWLNGEFLGEHEGGYSAFGFDMTDFLNDGDNAVVLRVWDPTDLDPQIPRGKQGGMWYTPSSGIWQTVYLEPVPPIRIETVHIYPRPLESRVLVRLRMAPSAKQEDLSVRFVLKDPDGAQAEFLFPWCGPAKTDHCEFILNLENQRLWSPEDPALYGLRVCLLPLQEEADCIETYFGQRWVTTDWAPGHSPAEQEDVRQQYKYIYLNGNPVFIRGLLDQSYHPEGIYTYPDETSLKKDLLLAKQMGFNFLRFHIKIDEPRRLYWADRLGLLVMADIPCMDHFAVNTRNSRCRPLWEAVLRRAVERDFNHPALISWCDFNETWGFYLPLPLPFNPCLQDWVEQMWHLTRELDPTRLVEDNSPTDWFQDHVVTDLNSWHFYLDDYTQVKEHLQRIDRETYPGSGAYYVGDRVQDGAPLLCSEYGPVSAFDGDRDISWGFKYQTNELRRHAKICGYVYTELTDVEWEHNGLLRYDRSSKEFGYEDAGIKLPDLTGADFLVLHSPPGVQPAPGSDLLLDVSVSYFSSGNAPADAEIFWKFSGYDDRGQAVKGPVGGPNPVRIQPYGMSDIVSLTEPMPAINMTGNLLVWARSDDLDWQVANVLPVDLFQGQSPRKEERETGEWVLCWDPGERLVSQWSEGDAQIVRAKGSFVPEAVAGFGSGFLEYRIPMPGEFDPQAIEEVALRLEASAAVGTFNLQTDEHRTPSLLLLSLNGIRMGEVLLPDAPADSRGFLSYLNAGFPFLYGSYGYLVSAEVSSEDLVPLKESLLEEGVFVLRLEVPEGDVGNGLRIYGDRLGRYALDPFLCIKTETPVP